MTCAGVGLTGVPGTSSPRPRDAVDDVRIVAAALAEHPHRQNARGPVDAGRPDRIVGVRADDAGQLVPCHVLTIPGSRSSLRSPARSRRDRTHRHRVRHHRSPSSITDHVVSGQQPAGHAGVRPDTRVEHCDDDRARAVSDVPRGRRGDAAGRIRQVLFGARVPIIDGPAPTPVDLDERDVWIPARFATARSAALASPATATTSASSPSCADAAHRGRSLQPSRCAPCASMRTRAVAAA